MILSSSCGVGIVEGKGIGVTPIETSPAKAASLSSGTDSLCCAHISGLREGIVISMPSWSAPECRASATSALAKGTLEKVRSSTWPAACVCTLTSPM